MKRAPGVLKKIAKFNIRQTHVGNTFKTCYKCVGYLWCTSGARRCTSLQKSLRVSLFWAKKNSTCLIIFEKLGMSRACDLYVPNKFHARYRRVEYALNAFGAHLKHASVRSMRVPILLDVASLACPKRV